MTYKELNERANQLGRVIRGYGVKPDDYVGIISQRSIEMIVGIYGILKSGGAYVPIDPEYPKDRIEYMIRDCKPKVIVIDEYIEGIGEIEDIVEGIPCIGLRDKEVYKGEASNLEHISGPNNLAYLIYTSGTTGRPKGVMIENIGVANLRGYFINNHNVDSEDRVLQFASMSFDAAVSELSMSILVGGTLFIVPDEIRADGNKFIKFMNENKISIGVLPPQYLTQLGIIELDKGVITAGSETNRELVARYSDKVPYSNDYGPTEATVCATHWQYKRGEEIPNNIPIGRPIQNTKIYIINGDELCGIGVPGEICISGIGLARGYLNKEELTKEKFIDNPYGEGRLYRSGDLGRWLEDGNIEYLGRIDDQVKIRGYRIELKEIESVIRGIEYVEDAAVIERNGDINAYIVSKVEIDATAIKDEIRKKLPEYMIPPYIKHIESIPLTRNGKLDKRSLPDIEVKSGHRYVAPTTKTQEKIVKVFEDILGIDRVGIDDNFFELGGDSIKAIRVVSKLRTEGIDITVQKLLHGNSIRQLELNSMFTINKFILVKKSVSNNDRNMFILPPGEGYGVAYMKLIDRTDFMGNIYVTNDPRFDMDKKDIERLDIDELTDVYYTMIKEHIKPNDIIMGYSLGGNIAYHLTHKLQEEQIDNQIIVIDSKPDLNMGDKDIDDKETLINMIRDLTDMKFDHNDSYKRLNEQLQGYLINNYLMNREDAKLFIDKEMSINKSNQDINFKSNKQIDCDIYGLFTNKGQDFIDGWSKLTRGEITYRLVEGIHSSLMDEDVKTTAEHLNEILRLME